MTGRVVVLDGVSSAGKSTLAAAMRDRLVVDGECWIVMATDDLFAKLSPVFLDLGAGEAGRHAELGVVFTWRDDRFDVRMGPVGLRLLDASRRAVAAVAAAGINVIVDEIVTSAEQLAGWQQALGDIDVTWVRLEIALDVVEERERARGDRAIGMARSQHDIVHRFVTYDITVDTGVLDADAAADVVVSALRTRR